MPPTLHRTPTPEDEYLTTDCVVVGGGLAGCTAALELADAGQQVDLFVKGRLVRESNSYLLAGGLASVPLMEGKPLSGDSFALHVKETLAAGKGLNNVSVVKEYIRSFPEVIDWLIKKGVAFDAADEAFPFSLHREGGHSKNRIFHVQDKTGMSIMASLVLKIENHPRIRLHEEHLAIDLITKNKLAHKHRSHDQCLGIYVYDIQRDIVRTIASKGVFLATGGLGKVFMYTTNADVSTGDGMAMCHRAGLQLANMEFVQFHPSVFYDKTAAHESERRFLLTEALRGAGAILKLHPDDKKDLMLKYDPRGSMATRDVIARAEDSEMRKNGLNHLWLDCSKIPKKKILKDFRSSYEYCKSKGFDMTTEPIPIVYAVHYSNGGVLVGRDGQTSMRGCYVLGESAYSGLHGATRLASNSGPECVVLGQFAARHFLGISDRMKSVEKVPLWDPGRAKELRDKTTVAYYWETVRRTMTSLCGVSRNQERLEAAREVLHSIRKNIHEFYWSYKVSKDFLEVRNIADVAWSIVISALARKESRACHYREDFEHENESRFHKITVVKSDDAVAFMPTSTEPKS